MSTDAKMLRHGRGTTGGSIRFPRCATRTYRTSNGQTRSEIWVSVSNRCMGCTQLATSGITGPIIRRYVRHMHTNDVTRPADWSEMVVTRTSRHVAPPSSPPGPGGRTILPAMPVLRSRLDPAAAETRANHDAMAAPGRGPAKAPGRAGRSWRRRRRPLHRAASRARQAPRSRTHRPTPRPGLPVPGAEPARRHRPVRRRRAGRRHRHRDRPGGGYDLRHRRQRCHRQGRHVLPDDGQEAPARAGDRAREPAAVHLSRRQRRRLPAAAGRRLSRTATTSGGSSTTRPGCRPRRSPRSRS